MSGDSPADAPSDRIELVAPDPTWPVQYQAEVSRLRAALGDRHGELQFEHIGSTAVQGLIAKPIIDVLVIPPADRWPGQSFHDAVIGEGYVFWAENPDARHQFFVKGMPPFGSGRTHHVHVRPIDTAMPIIRFRDWLRQNPDRAAAYADLKSRLAKQFPADREAYTRGKDTFIADAIRLS